MEIGYSHLKLMVNSRKIGCNSPHTGSHEKRFRCLFEFFPIGDADFKYFKTTDLNDEDFRLCC